MQTLEELKVEASKIGAKISKIEHESRTETNRQHVGRYFKYRNCYSCPEKPSDYWWHYVKVQKVDDAGMLTVFMFETDKYGKTSTGVDEHRYHLDDYMPCPAAEFNKAWRAFQKRIAAMVP